MLGYCVGCAGMSARVNTVGKLYISWFFSPGSTYDYTVTADVQWENGFKKSAESAVKIEAVTAGEDEDVYTKGTGVPLSFANPLVTHAEIDAIYARYNGRTWYPSTCTWRGDPCVEVGDIITVKDKNNKSYTVYVAQQELDLSGGLQSTITSPNLDTTEMSFDSVSASVKLELSKVKNSMEAAIKAATDAINGANGGYYRILDLDKDGNPDGWECFATDGLQGVKCTYGGIGCTTNGGKTYTNAMTGAGINATAITTGIITGGTNGFSFNLESGHIEASDINITGGDINLDGGSLSIESDAFKTDLSGGYLQMYYATNMATGTNYNYLTVTDAMVDNYYYATFASPLPSIDGINTKGFRFGESDENKTGIIHWQTDYALIEKARARFRQCVEVNEIMTVDSNGESIGFISHAPFRSTDISAEIGATNEAKAFMQLANNSKGTIPARINIYSSGSGGAGMSLELKSGGGYTGRLFVDNTGLYAEFNGNGIYKKLA